jgi:hypothetical protein
MVKLDGISVLWNLTRPTCVVLTCGVLLHPAVWYSHVGCCYTQLCGTHMWSVATRSYVVLACHAEWQFEQVMMLLG